MSVIFGIPIVRCGAHRHQVARLLEAPAHGVRSGRAPVEVDEAFVAEPGALPDAERRIELDRRRRQAVLERGHIDDRLERRARLAKRLRRPVVAGSDDVEAALHGEHAAGVHFLGEHPARDLRDRAELHSMPGPSLLDDDDHARLQSSRRPRRRRRAPGMDAAEAGRGARRAVGEADARAGRILATGRPPSSSRDSRCRPARDRAAPAQSLLRSTRHAEVAPAAAAVEAGEAVAKRLRGGVLHHRVHRGADPQAAAHKGCSGRLRPSRRTA